MLGVTSSGQGLTVKAPAKVNLTLRVLGVRDDGYHDLESVVAAVALFDTLLFELADGIHLVCRGMGVPGGEDNLVMTAARVLADECRPGRGARIRLEKRIPPGRGFGGGSSDAAAALVGLNALWDCGLERQELARLGAGVGSDVPLFLASPLSVMRGRGERVERVSAGTAWWLVLAWPDYEMPTAEVYAAYDRLGASPDGGPAATDILPRLAGPARGARPFLVNDLEAAADSIRRGRFDVRGCLKRAGATAIGMTGSGSAYFAIADTEVEARRLAEAACAACAAGAKTYVTTLLADGEQQERPT